MTRALEWWTACHRQQDNHREQNLKQRRRVEGPSAGELPEHVKDELHGPQVFGREMLGMCPWKKADCMYPPVPKQRRNPSLHFRCPHAKMKDEAALLCFASL